MTTKVYASREQSAFPPNEPVREHDGFYIATTQDSFPGTFDIIAKVDDDHIEILHNTVTTMTYDAMLDLMVWAVQ